MKKTFVLDIASPADYDFIFSVLRKENKETFGFYNEKAWGIMADLICRDDSGQTTTVCKVDGCAAGFYTVITDPNPFWASFKRRYGIVSCALGRMMERRRAGKKPVIEDRPVDPEYAERARRRFESVPGRACGYFIYVDAERAGPLAASLIHFDMEKRLIKLGFHTLEGRVVHDNDTSLRFHAASGFEVRSIGEAWYIAKTLRNNRQRKAA